jgi:murein L,D-transpeptidase YafK
LAACGNGDPQSTQSSVSDGTKADYILVDKSDREMLLYRKGKIISRYKGIQFGDAPIGHKQFEGDERTPEGDYTISGRNPASRYHLSLRISYPNAADRALAKAKGKSPGGDIFIHGQPNWSPLKRLKHDWTDGCIAVTNAEIEQIWKLVPDGAKITIRP